MFDKLTQLFDLSGDALRAVFQRAAKPEAWSQGPLPGVLLFHFEGGPRVAELDSGFVRLERGMPFPRHRHTASERVLILEGGYHDHDQHWFGPGDVHDMVGTTEHALSMNPERETLLAVILSGEIQIVDP